MDEKDQIIDISFGVEDYRCKDAISYNGMTISSAHSTFLHYESILDSLKQDSSYQDKLITELSIPVKIKKIIHKGKSYERTLEIETPIWIELIMKYKDEKKEGPKKAINRDAFGKYLQTTDFRKPEQILFMQNLSSIYYKLPTWKDSLDRLKKVFVKLQDDAGAGGGAKGGGSAKGGKRTIRKNHKKKKRTHRKSSKKRRMISTKKRIRKTFKKRRQRRRTINKVRK